MRYKINLILYLASTTHKRYANIPKRIVNFCTWKDYLHNVYYKLYFV